MPLDFERARSRKRRRSPRASAAQAPSPTRYYYDESDDEEGGKGSRDHSAQAYGGACSLGKFFLNPCLCLTTATRIFCQQIVRQRRRSASRRQSRREDWRVRRKELFSAILIFASLWIIYTSLLRNDDKRWIMRPPSDWQLDRLPVVLRLFDFSTVDDVGGWIYNPRPFADFPALDQEDYDEESSSAPDYGGLKFSSLSDVPASEFRRQISPTDFLVYENERIKQIEEMDKHHVSLKYLHDEEIEFSNRQCRRPNWKSAYYPNCNSFHELDLSRPFDSEYRSEEDVTDYDSFRFSHGYYRDVWSIKTRTKDHLILKLLRYKHKVDHRMMHTVQKDAVVMERLTASSRIVDVYGHCGTSVHVEPVAYEVEEYIVPGEGYMKQHELDDSQDVNPQNSYSATEKLEMALEMAESLAEIHGFKDGVIVHDDVQPCQWLRTRDNKLKLGDFNRAEIMDFNEEEKQYCKYNNGEAYGNYRSPEEFAAKDIDEKIDIWSLGNNIYALLTGLWVFYDIDDDGVTQKKLIDGNLPFVDDRYRTRSYAEGKLVEVMERCWEFDPSLRMDIFEIVNFLREAMSENARKEAGNAK